MGYLRVTGDGGVLLDDGVAEGYISRLASLISQKTKKRKKKRFCRTSDQVNLSHYLASTSSLYPTLFQDNDTFGFLIESPVRDRSLEGCCGASDPTNKA